MKYAYAAIAAAQLAAAHTTFQSFVIGGKDQGHHFAVQTPSNGNNPIKDVTSTSMICNGGTKAADQVKVAAGSEITMQWHHSDTDGTTPSGDGDEPIAASHKGPVMVYVAPAASNGEGDVWVKIFEEGLTGGKWAVEKFIANKGQITVTLPDLAAGDYLIRPEIIGLHEANRSGGAQFYNGCGQITVSGGSAKLPAGVDMTKAYSATDAGVLFDIYSGKTTYPIPGPKVWDGASSGSPTKESAPSAVVKEEVAASSAASTPSSTPSASPAAGSGSGSALPKSFTMTEFISWLREAAGSSASKARRHARSFA